MFVYSTRGIWLVEAESWRNCENMILGVDASNIRGGGGVTHLVELFRAADPTAFGFSQVIVWSGQETLSRIEGRPWLVKRHQSLLDRSFPYRMFWQRLRLAKLARMAGCDLLFVPGGSYVGDFGPIVTMSRNLLPFEWREVRRFGWSVITLRLLLLRLTLSRTFRKADAVIYLTQYARDTVMKVTGAQRGRSVIIPHGIHPRFFLPLRPQRPVMEFNDAQPCRVLYVSIVDAYKHQWHVAAGVAQLRSTGVPVVLDLIGPHGAGMNRLIETMRHVDPTGAFITYRGAVPYDELHKLYEYADIGVFASTCENMPNILLEGMAAGLPMACSRKEPMLEILGDAGVYFDPENADDIARALRELIDSPRCGQGWWGIQSTVREPSLGAGAPARPFGSWRRLPLPGHRDH